MPWFCALPKLYKQPIGLTKLQLLELRLSVEQVAVALGLSVKDVMYATQKSRRGSERSDRSEFGIRCDRTHYSRKFEFFMNEMRLR